MDVIKTNKRNKPGLNFSFLHVLLDSLDYSHVGTKTREGY